MKMKTILAASGLALAILALAPRFGQAGDLHQPLCNPVSGDARFGGPRLAGAVGPGLEIPARVGTPVHPVAHGVVSWSGWSDRWGWMVRVRHFDGSVSSYMHLKGRGLAREGTVVLAQTGYGPPSVLGRVGRSGVPGGARRTCTCGCGTGAANC